MTPKFWIILKYQESPPEVSKEGYIFEESLITEVVEFVRGKAIAFCHDDKRPSLYLGNKGDGRAVCPVCNQVFSALDVLIKRDNLSFKEAVMRLGG